VASIQVFKYNIVYSQRRHALIAV